MQLLQHMYVYSEMQRCEWGEVQSMAKAKDNHRVIRSWYYNVEHAKNIRIRGIEPRAIA